MTDDSGLKQASARGQENFTVAEWQPIETAPKDGTFVLLAVRDFVLPGAWLHPAFAEGPGWYAWMLYFGIRQIQQPYATHWMPLPEPPVRAALNNQKVEGDE